LHQCQQSQPAGGAGLHQSQQSQAAVMDASAASASATARLPKVQSLKRESSSGPGSLQNRQPSMPSESKKA